MCNRYNTRTLRVDELMVTTFYSVEFPSIYAKPPYDCPAISVHVCIIHTESRNVKG